VEDISRAFLAALEATRELVHDEAFNVGSSTENYCIPEVTETVSEVMPSMQVSFAEGSGPDKRSYQVDCTKLARGLPEARPQWTVRRGAEELRDASRPHGMSAGTVAGPHFLRIKRVQELQEARRGRRRAPSGCPSPRAEARNV
jgi:hypothetical protein